MIINSDSTGMENLLLRVQDAIEILPDLLSEAAQRAGESVADALGDAAPRGKGEESIAPEGDAPGPLAESFFVTASNQAGAEVVEVEVRTTQPTKLDYVMHGTGLYGKYGARIVPTVKKALFWPNADHPYKSVAGQRPNDFVSPALDTTDEYVEPEIESILGELSVILGGGT